MLLLLLLLLLLPPPLAWVAADALVGQRVVSDVHLKSGETLTLSSGSVSLCPGGPRTCSFATNSTLDVTRATTVTIGSGGMHIPHLLVHGGGIVVLSSAGAAGVAGAAPTSLPAWTFDSVRLAGGTLEVAGKSARATSKTLTFAPSRNPQASRTSTSTNRSAIVIASGATFATTDRSSSLRVTGAAMVHLRHASSRLQVGGGLTSESGALFLWTLGGNSADPQKFVSQIVGNINVEGNCVIAGGTTAMVQQDRNMPVKATAEVGATVSALMSAVEFSGKFDSVVLGKQMQCARASTSESWSSFSMLVSSQCLSQCAVQDTCTTTATVPSAARDGSDTAGASSGGETSGGQNGASDALPLVITVFSVIGAVVVVAVFGHHVYRARRASTDDLLGISHPGMMSRRRPNTNTKQPISGTEGGESDTVSLLVP